MFEFSLATSSNTALPGDFRGRFSRGYPSRQHHRRPHVVSLGLGQR
jgi:hypothetical protein